MDADRRLLLEDGTAWAQITRGYSFPRVLLKLDKHEGHSVDFNVSYSIYVDPKDAVRKQLSLASVDVSDIMACVFASATFIFQCEMEN